MDQVDDNINKDMYDSDLIDVDYLDFSDDQTWLYTYPTDSGQHVDILDWNLSCDWPINEDSEYHKKESDLLLLLDEILKNGASSTPDKHKFDSRTYVRPKKRAQRPSIQVIVETPTDSPSITSHASQNKKYLTYNKYSGMPLGPMLRLKTFNVDTNTENSSTVKEYALKRKSLALNDETELENMNMSQTKPDSEQSSSKPINIDLSQPVHNLHNKFNRCLPNAINERDSLDMPQSGELLMLMSPPSLVSSILMDNSGTFNRESMDGRKSLPSYKDSGLPSSGRESLDSMMTSMSLSILDEKDMNTSFLSQTTYPDNESFMDSLPPSLVSSVNSSYIMSNTPKQRQDSMDHPFNLTHTEKLLTGRPRCNLFNTITKRESGITNSDSYTKSREEASQADHVNVLLNENCDKKAAPKSIPSANSEINDTMTVHYSSNKFRKVNSAEKENVDDSFELDDAFYKDMGEQRAIDIGKNSLNITMDKQEMNEIIQARQKLSLARKALPNERDIPLPNQADTSKVTVSIQNQTTTVPRTSMETASQVLSRIKAMNANNAHDKKHERQTREISKANISSKSSNSSASKTSENSSAMNVTVVISETDANQTKQIIDINAATFDLIDCNNKAKKNQEEWFSQERAMVGSGESTDTGTSSSSSPPAYAAENAVFRDRKRSSSTPILAKDIADYNNLENNISPIFHVQGENSPLVANEQAGAESATMQETFIVYNTPDHLTKDPSSGKDKRISSTPVAFAKDIADMNNSHVISPILYAQCENTPLVADEQAGAESALIEKTYTVHDTPFQLAKERDLDTRKVLTPATANDVADMNNSECNMSPIFRVKGENSPLVADEQAGAESALIEKTYTVHGTPFQLAKEKSSGSLQSTAAALRKSSLPTFKYVRQYSSHKELNRIPGNATTTRSSVARMIARRSVYASNPALSHASPPSVSQESTSLAAAHKQGVNKETSIPSRPQLIKQGTVTLHRDNTKTKLVPPGNNKTKNSPEGPDVLTFNKKSVVAPRRSSMQASLMSWKDKRAQAPVASGVAYPLRNQNTYAPTTRPTAGPSQLRSSTSTMIQRPAPARVVPCNQQRPFSGTGAEARVPSQARPSRLPSPRKVIRSSTYSLAPSTDADHY